MSRLHICELLDEFSIRSAADFHKLGSGRKPYFISRLYKALAGSFETSLEDIRAARGLRLHFAGQAVRGHAPSNIPSDAFLKKLAFYASRTLITFPFNKPRIPGDQAVNAPAGGHAAAAAKYGKVTSPLLFGEVKTRRGAAGGEVERVGKAYHVDPRDFDDFISLLCRARTAIEAGIVHVLPVFSADEVNAIARYRNVLLPANFRLAGLQRQFGEDATTDGVLVTDPASITALYLPTLSKASIEMIVSLRRKESEAYNLLQRKLENLLFKAKDVESETKLLEYLHAIDEGVVRLNRKFMSALKDFGVKEALGAGTSALAILLTPLVGPAMTVAAQGFAGGITATAIVKPYLEYRKEVREVQESEFYLPWRIFRSQRSWFA